MSSTIDKITLDAVKPGIQLERTLTNYYKSIESKNPDFKHPKIKVLSSSKLEKTAIEDAKKLVELKNLYDAAKKKGDKDESNKYKAEFKALKAKKSKSMSDVIDLNDIDFVKNFDFEFIETKQGESLTSHISDPELRGLVDILTQKQEQPKVDKADKADKITKKEQQKIKVKKILKSMGLEVHNSHLSTSIKRFLGKLENMEWFRMKTFNGLFKPVLSKNGTTKRYLINVCYNFDTVLEQFIKGVSKQDIISAMSKNAFAVLHYKEEKPDISQFTKEMKEEVKKEMMKLRSIDNVIDFLALHEINDLKSHFMDYKEIINKIGRISGAEYTINDAITFVKTLVKVSTALNDVNTFSKIDKDGKTKESTIGDMFIKDILIEIPVKIPLNLRKKILTAIAEKKEIELVDSDVEIFETYEGGITNMNTFENLSTVSNSDLKNLKAVRQAIGIRLFVEVLRKIDRMTINHNGKYGYVVTIYC